MISLQIYEIFPNGKYTLYDKEGKSVEAVYDTDYESDNGLDEDEEGYACECARQNGGALSGFRGFPRELCFCVRLPNRVVVVDNNINYYCIGCVYAR